MAIHYPVDRDRNVIPRWRDFVSTAQAGELGGQRGVAQQANLLSNFERKVAEWREERTLTFATDLVGTAIVVGRESEARDAAAFIIDCDRSTELARTIARRILTGSAASREVTDFPGRDIKAKLASLRRRTREFAGNAIVWADLARAHASLGHLEQADRAMVTARALAPQSRFILRAASRLLIHLERPNEAHAVLKRAEGLSGDPWIIAAEIAVALSAGASPRSVRAGRELIESGRFADRDLSELASALSTLEYQAGNEKRARRLLRLGLRDPSDNTLAQAQWLSAQLGFDVPELDLGIKGNALSFEARALETFRRGQWGQSLSSARSWLGDQPFSSRPAIHGSYVASVALEDYDATEELARAGLEANQFDPTLLNNLAYALIQKGKLEEAASEFKKAQRSARRPEERIALLATAGLYALRNGAVDEGRTLYRHAIEISEAAGLKRYAAHAAINLATESIRSHLGSVFEDVLFAEGAAESVQDADIQVLLTRLRARKQAFRLA